jgi:hypothetical protein
MTSFCSPLSPCRIQSACTPPNLAVASILRDGIDFVRRSGRCKETRAVSVDSNRFKSLRNAKRPKPANIVGQYIDWQRAWQRSPGAQLQPQHLSERHDIFGFFAWPTFIFGQDLSVIKEDPLPDFGLHALKRYDHGLCHILFQRIDKHTHQLLFSVSISLAVAVGAKL